MGGEGMNEENLSFQDTDFSKLVKKAKRTSYIKTIVISVTVCLVLAVSLYLSGTILLQKRLDHLSEIEAAWQYVKGANIEDTGTSYLYTPFGATLISGQIKDLDGMPFPWGERQQSLSIWGPVRTTQSVQVFGQGEVNDERIPLYYKGERVIEFFHPEIEYAYLPDERDLLNKIDENKIVEFAFSFAQPITTEEAKALFADHVNWYWVDTYRKEDLEDDTIGTIGNDAFGFSEDGSVELFMNQVEWLAEHGGTYKQQSNKMIKALKDKQGWESESLPIIGVVVTGSPNELKQYMNVPLIRTAILGVTVDRY